MESTDFCMRRKCKTCPINETCEQLNNTLKQRLMWKPFENLKELLEKKDDK